MALQDAITVSCDLDAGVVLKLVHLEVRSRTASSRGPLEQRKDKQGGLKKCPGFELQN